VTVGNEEVLVNATGFIDTSKYVVVGPAEEVNKINEQLGCKNERRGSSDLCVVIELVCVE
jgi:hypothetical protein